MTNLEKFHFYLRDLESPTHFIDWNFYFMISSTLGRKVWFSEGEFPIYPNMYMIFVGSPSTGKSLPANKVTEILSSLKSATVDPDTGQMILKDIIKCAPDSLTLEALFRELVNATDKIKLPAVPGKPQQFYAHSSVCFCIGDELGLLFREKSNDLVTFMTKGWDAGNFKRVTKTQGTDVINNMCINLLGCCVQDWVRMNIDASMIQGGFTSRVIFIWGEKPRHRVLFLTTSDEQKQARIDIQEHLKKIAKLCGPVSLSPEARDFMEKWAQEQDNFRVNKDKNLEGYYGRKKIHLLKLACAIHFGENAESMTIGLPSIISAVKTLASVEIDMHKALAIGGRNPLAEMSDRILRNLKANGFRSQQRLYVDHWELGNTAEINECLNYLRDTAQIEPAMEENKQGFKLKMGGGL